ncbi:hypothetical protein BC937DRAFT_92590 [Endogone sp. FLAS-F59071]|nr:hypothetical protein BC937DRAFT_92590 [Endogone sp. FLAS-F59071]|eukprot:RUS15322.1 hypothetical protein BC937DRAFT_92590 [Endogone sp. FLAS-F59071]
MAASSNMANPFTPELITSILSYLHDYPQTLRHCILINKEWHTIARSQLYHTPRLVTRAAWRKFIISLVVKPELGTFVRRLDLSRVVNRAWLIKEWEVVSVFRLCRNVEEIDLAGCAKIQHLSPMTPFWTRVRHLRLSGCDVANLSLLSITANCSTYLTTIDFSGCRNVTSEALYPLVINSPSLRHLDVSSSAVGDELFDGIARIQHLGGARNLLSLRCLRCYGVLFDSGAAIRLRELDLRGCRISGKNLFPFVERNPELTYLALGMLKSMPCITDRFLSHVAAYCPRIRELVLLGCINVTSASVAKLVAGCTELERLHLYKGGINEKDVMTIVNGLPRLRELNVASRFIDKIIDIIIGQ